MHQNIVCFFVRSVFLFAVLFGFNSFAFAISFSDLNANGIADADESSVIASTTMSLPAGEYIFRNLTIVSGTKITAESNQHSPNAFKGVKITADNLTLESNSYISADGQGYSAGPGAGADGAIGASYGGVGGSNTATSTYGSAMMPTDLGSGTSGYRGGGSIRLVVSGTLLLDGDISSNGGGYRTSGGSMYVTTNNLTGTGTFNANGGSTSWPYSYAGGGGRIAVYYQQSSFTGSAKVKAGVYCFYGCNPAGGPGTAIFIDMVNNDLYVKDSFRFQANDAPFNFRNIIIEGSTSAEIEKNIPINAVNISIKNSSSVVVKNRSTVNAKSLVLDQNSSFTILDAPAISIPLINVGQGSILTLSGSETLVSDTMNIKNGGILTVPKGHTLLLNIPNLNIAFGGIVSADQKGFDSSSGPGTPIEYYDGASYGGVGYGNSATSTYGSPEEPIDFGSGGNGHPSYAQGGGAIKIVSDKTLIVDGTISADGGITASGGSIYVITKNLSGSGTLQANGGGFYWQGQYVGMGGGGRVALHYATSTFTGQTFSKGGCNSFDGWSKTCADNGTVFEKKVESTCQINCFSNVLFLPGVMGSRLYDEQGNELWVSSNDPFQAKLGLNPDGRSVNAIHTKDDIKRYPGEIDEKGLVDDVYGSNIYESFVNDLRDWKGDGKTGIIADYSFIPYDWRLSLDDIISNGATSTSNNLSYGTSQDFSASYILKQLEQLQKTSRTGKVSIIAHSNGGLVTKAFIQKLKDTNNPLYDKIDKVILIAVPQVGTPEAIAGILHGAPLGYGGIMTTARSRDLAKNMPTMYNMLPSAPYFNVVNPGYAVGKMVSFENKPSFDAQLLQYGVYVSNEDELKGYILNDDNRPIPGYLHIYNPAVGNRTLYDKAQSVHAVLDKWQPASSTKLILVAGWGEETLSGIDYVNNGKLSLKPRHVVDGDGTVVEPSALWTPTSMPNTERWWVDLDKYDTLTTIGRVHRDILEIQNLRNFIKSEIDNSAFNDTSDVVVNATSTLVSTGTRLHFTLHSPLTLGIMDSAGRYTGLDPVTREIKEEIPNTTYKQYGEVQFLSVPAGLQYTMKLKGYEKGSFALDVEKQLGNTVTESTTFQAIPSATTTVVTMDISPVFTVASSTLSIDQNADGVTDVSLGANPGGVTTYDLTAPTTTATPLGTLGSNGYHTSFVKVTLASGDLAPFGEVSSGVASTKYSLDSGITWNTYSTSTPLVIATEGTISLQYYSVDNNGNSETTKTLTLSIDTVAPTIFASDVSAEQLTVEGTTLTIPSTVKDSIDANPTLTTNVPLTQIFAPGVTNILLTAQDLAGNIATSTIIVTIFSSPTADPDQDGVPNQDDVKPFDATVFANLTIPSEYALWEKGTFDLPFSVAGKGNVTLSLSNTYYRVGTSPVKDAIGAILPATVTTTDGLITVLFAQSTKDLKTYTLTLTTTKGNIKERDSIKRKMDNETNTEKKNELEKELNFSRAPVILSIINTTTNKTTSQTATINIYDKEQSVQAQYKYKDTDQTTTLILKSDDILKLKKGQPLALTVKVTGIKKDVPFTTNIRGNFTMLSVVQEEEHDNDTNRKQTKFSLFFPFTTPSTQESITITTMVNGTTKTEVVGVRFEK